MPSSFKNDWSESLSRDESTTEILIEYLSDSEVWEGGVGGRNYRREESSSLFFLDRKGYTITTKKMWEYEQ